MRGFHTVHFTDVIVVLLLLVTLAMQFGKVQARATATVAGTLMLVAFSQEFLIPSVVGLAILVWNVLPPSKKG